MQSLVQKAFALLLLTGVAFSYVSSNLDVALNDTSSKDVAIILDTSGSMKGYPLEMAKNASINFVNGLKGARMMLTTFNFCNPRVNVDWTYNSSKVINEIIGLKAVGSTPIYATLYSTYKMLKATSPNRTKYIVLFSDGGETCGGDPCALVERMSKNITAPIYVIGYLVGKSDIQMLSCIANKSGGKLYYANDSKSVNDILQEISRIIRRETEPIKCEELSDCPEGYVCNTEKKACVKATISLMFIPLNWDKTDEEFDEVVNKMSEVVMDSLPMVASCRSGLYTHSDMRSSCDIGEISDDVETLKKVKKCVGLKRAEKYDFVVAITDDDLGSTQGFTARDINIIVARPNYDIVVAHELGHQFGLNDEYCYCDGEGVKCGVGPNPLLPELGCDPQGNCCWVDKSRSIENLFGLLGGRSCRTGYEDRGCFVCCIGNRNIKGGFSIMSYANLPNNKYHDSVSLDHLNSLEELKCNW